MKVVLALLLTIALSLPGAAKEFKLYAMLLENTPVELTDGAQWMMDKGDVFPVVMYKEMQTKIVLQLAGTSFRLDTNRVRILQPKEVAAGLVSYRKNVNSYVESKSKQMKTELKQPATGEKASEAPLPAR